METLERDGVLILDGVYSPEKLVELRQQFNEEWGEIFNNTLEWKIAKFKETDTQTFFLDNAIYESKRFADYKGNTIVDMGCGRYDFISKHTIDNLMTPEIEAIITHFLKKNWSGFLGGLPVVGGFTSDDGYWHRDMISLFEDEEIDINLPPIYLTMIIPLENISPGQGTTEFLPGSHKINFNKMGITSNDSLKEWISTQETLNGEMKAGSVCIFNGLTLHRGTKNLSSNCRNAYYIVFKKNWYSDDDPKNYILF